MRTCACGCGASMEGRQPKARYATDVCRAYASDVRRGVRPPRERSAALYADSLTVAYFLGATLALTWGCLLGMLVT